MSASRPVRREVSGHVALGFVQVCFGLFPVFGVLAMRTFTPVAVVVWRVAFGALALGAIAILVHGRAAIPRRRDWARFGACSMLGVTVNMTLYLEGLQRSTADDAALMMCLIPVFTFTVAALVRQEAFDGSRALGVGVALVGASMLYWAEEPGLASRHALGNSMMAANTLSYAIYLVASRPLLSRYPPVVVIAWMFLLATPFLPFLAHGEHLVPQASGAVWGSLAFILLFPTAIAYLLNAFALSRLRASTTAVYVYVQLLITGAGSRWLLGERPTRGILLSAACVLAGIWLVARKKGGASPAPAGA
jgi:drug/metabolite transporter (DMT)-like permease